MGQVLHGSATTTEAVRRAIQHSHVWTALADQGLFGVMRSSRVRSCLRPHMMDPPSIVFCRWRSEVSSLSRRASPANLICGTARGARSFSIDFARVDGAFICTALKHGT